MKKNKISTLQNIKKKFRNIKIKINFKKVKRRKTIKKKKKGL